MFEIDNVWGDTEKEELLCKSLFDKIENVASILPITKPVTNTNTKDSVKSPDRLTREQWKRKQKRLRKAGKNREGKLNISTDKLKESLPNSNKEVERHTDTLLIENQHVGCSKGENIPPAKKRKKEQSSIKDSAMGTNEQRKQSSAGKLLENKLTAKLRASRFRYINEQMYTRTSKETMELFKDRPESFQVYHSGYLAQVAKWPVKPLDLIIKWVKTKPTKLVIADFGCGEAFLSQNVKNKVYSFDLFAVNQHVTIADISHVPLEAASVDIVVFCLALMGTNMQDFLLEANRVLKPSGILKIAEVASRFDRIKKFLSDMRRLGFQLLKKNLANSHFYMFDFQKVKNLQKDTFQHESLRGLQLKPCLYKKR